MWTARLLVVAAAILAPAAPARPDEGAKSKPVEKDGISATLSLAGRTVLADGQPALKVRFENTSRDYLNLYDVEACWKWRVVFTRLDAAAGVPKTWKLEFAVVPEPLPVAHKQVKPGEAYETAIDLANDPPFTFTFVGEGAGGQKARPVRHLGPGRYEARVTVSLGSPFGAGTRQWTGPVTTGPVQFTVVDRRGRAEPSRKDLAAYERALQPVLTLITETPGGLWMNGTFPNVKLARDADPEDVIAAVVNVNRSNIGTKAYRVLSVKKLEGEGGRRFVALVAAGKATKAVLCFPISEDQWWSRTYDAVIEADLAAPPRPAGK